MNKTHPLVTSNIYTAQKTHGWRRFYAGRWEFLFILEGKLQVEYNGKNLELEAEKVNFLIYKPGYSYRFNAESGAKYINVRFYLRDELAGQISFTEVIEGVGCFSLSQSFRRRIKRDLLEIVKLERKQTQQWETLNLLIAETVLLRVCTLGGNSGEHNPKLLKAFLLLSQMDDVPIKTVAKECGLSIPVFYQLFKQETGNTPHEYRERVKLCEAARQLIETSKLLCEIASELNMHDQYHLSKRFKKYYGVSPSAYRKQNK